MKQSTARRKAGRPRRRATEKSPDFLSCLPTELLHHPLQFLEGDQASLQMLDSMLAKAVQGSFAKFVQVHRAQKSLKSLHHITQALPLGGND